MAKFMRTIADRRDEVSKENLSTQPLLTNDYTYGNIQDTSENISNKIPDFTDVANIDNDNTTQKPEERTRKDMKATSKIEMDKLKEKYPVQQVCDISQTQFTVDEIQDSVDEINPDSGTRERG